MPIRPENRKRYPKNWKAISNRIRFQRAGGQCEFIDPETGERCTAQHGHSHPITGSIVILTTAHLDHKPENCSDDNLKAACQRCHNLYDQAHRIKNRKRRKEQERRRIMDKAGQIQFQLDCGVLTT